MTRTILALMTAVAFVAPIAADDLASKQEQQRLIREETERTVRRLQTILRVMAAYQPGEKAQKLLLEEVAGTLNGLSQEQMAEVISRLEAAAKITDETRSEKELELAYARHREILLVLRGLLARYDAVKSLEQLADRLDKLAQQQLENHLVIAKIINELQDRPKEADADRPARKPQKNLGLDIRQQADGQADLHKTLEGLVKQGDAMKVHLGEPDQKRLEQAKAHAFKHKILDNLDLAAKKLQQAGYPEIRHKAYQEASELQWHTATQLKEL